MFKLDQLEVAGFKSFVDPVSLRFAGGLTAIVGPNGCGKSNLADAILWVLGERSAKHMRAAKMEDVIFNGAEKRRPLGSAAVELTLSTDPDFELANDGILKVSRRVFRSGESEYRLNGRRVRLKDVRDLLMDTGLGLREYSVIEQGRIGQILSGKPQERRKLIEEAAGITRYRDRRRLAEIKLEEARANLERLDDIVDEVERSLRSLKRQAGAARRFEKRRERYRDLQSAVLVARWARIHQRLDHTEGRLAEAVEREGEVVARLHGDEAALTERREKTEALAAELAERHRRQAELAATIEGRQQIVKSSRQRLEETGERLASGRSLAERRGEEVAELQASLETLTTQITGLADELGDATSHADREGERIRSVELRCREAEAELEGLRERLMDSLGNCTTLRNRLHREQVEREKGRYRLQQIDQELTRRAQALEDAGEALEKSRQALETREEEVARREESAGERRSELEGLGERAAELEERRLGLADRLADRQRRRRFLLELSEAWDERRSALEERLAAVGVDKPELLADRIRVKDGWERTLDHYLGELAEAVVLPAGADPLALVERLADGHGSARLLRALPAGAGVALDDPAIVGALGDALSLPQELARALPPAYLVDRPEDALRLAAAHPGVAFLARSRVWAREGVVHVQAEKAEPGALARGKELDSLARELPEIEAEWERLLAEITALRERREKAARALEHLESELAAGRQELAVLRARHEDEESRLRRLELERETLAEERLEVERELARLEGATRHVEEQLQQSETRHQELEATFDAAQQRVTEAHQAREEARTAGAAQRGQLRLLETQLESLRREEERNRRGIRAAEEQAAEWKSEETRLEARRQETREAIDRAEQELQVALENRAVRQEEVAGRQQELERQRSELGGIERRIRGIREELDEVRTVASGLRESRAELRQDAEHLAREFREAFGEELPAEPGEPRDDLQEMEARLADQKDALDRTGPVNLLAAEEYREKEERLTFLTEQREDVERSVASLRKTILEINRTSTERFTETFQAVNEIFSATFRDLFRGGEASMHLLDEDDLLETGVEIVARPPGKRLQNIMLLSGGEKALTAIALLFALFRTKPSPFCVLDEVDAPLDDINTLRFVELLRRLATDTQFVVITHNKLTMEAASMLYGVTMQERGVSRLVSVAMDEVQEPRRVATA